MTTPQDPNLTTATTAAAVEPTTPATTPPPVEPTAPAAEPAASTDVADALRNNDALAAMLVSQPKAPKKPKREVAAKPPETTPEPPAQAAPEKPAEPEPKAAEPAEEPAPVKVRKTQPKSELTAERVAQIAAEAAARVAQPQQQQQPRQPEPTPVPEALRKIAPVYQKLEQLHPEKYKDLLQKEVKFIQMETQRADEWERAAIAKGVSNPIYDASDPEHAAFYAKYQPQVDPDDMDDAKFEIKFEQRYTQKVLPELQEARQVATQLKAAPEAAAAVENFRSALYGSVDEKLAKLSDDGIKKFAEENPIEAELLVAAETEIKPVVSSVSMLWDGAAQFNPQDPAHTTAAKTFERFEAEMAAASADYSDEKGRRWVPWAQYQSLPDAQKKQFCTTTKEALVRYIGLCASSNVKNLAKSEKERVERHATRMGFSKQNVAQVQQTPIQQTLPKPAPVASPSVSSGTVATAPMGGAPSTAPAPTNRFESMLITR